MINGYTSLRQNETRWVIRAVPEERIGRMDQAAVTDMVTMAIQRWWAHGIMRVELSAEALELHLIPLKVHQEQNGGETPSRLADEVYHDVDFSLEEKHCVPRG